MSLEACAWALRQQLDCPIAKLILISLADHHNASTGKCFPSRRKLAEAGCCSTRTVVRKLHYLEAEGWIAVEAHFTPSGRQDRNSYTLHFGRKGGGGHSDTLPGNDAQSKPGGCQSPDTHEGDGCVSPLNSKKNGKKKRAGARERTPAGDDVGTKGRPSERGERPLMVIQGAIASAAKGLPPAPKRWRASPEEIQEFARMASE